MHHIDMHIEMYTRKRWQVALFQFILPQGATRGPRVAPPLARLVFLHGRAAQETSIFDDFSGRKHAEADGNGGNGCVLRLPRLRSPMEVGADPVAHKEIASSR